ncbi:MAG: hypothetical protein INQ03_12645 [Candidatus Heimdallarchaeota archaeon]|nr:hypothetical protein [Candidatus Heimdallarchaeota archaeon]
MIEETIALLENDQVDFEQIQAYVKKLEIIQTSTAKLHTLHSLYQVTRQKLGAPSINKKILLKLQNNFNLPPSHLVPLLMVILNPAFEEYRELFKVEEILDTNELIELNTALNTLDASIPQQSYPYDLVSQMQYIIDHWNVAPSKLLLSIDLLKEEHKPHFTGPGEAYIYQSDEEGEERFTPDMTWMPKTILLAKNVYVWMDQLSRKHKMEIRTIADIPDVELEEIKQQGFNALWLIGIWQRSYASRRIKQIRGNIDAVSSAYAIHDYQISDRIGGEDLLKQFQERLMRYGIRLGADMVPNHMACDSKWVIENPEWFIQSDTSPYSYNFENEDLCQNPDVSIHIDNGYYNETDAAVVFKRYDHHTQKACYIYHGNDGTAIPWNDTAQLNFLLPEVRERVIQQIIDVAKVFPIIRFDAAMTLVKKHIRRLWYPKPGEGGAIPSRSLSSMGDEEFERYIPVEFWREVVDRINQEVPNTLLLAEAFWMLEGYFVRSLGMHRVYNSAFMHMLRDEENAKYRQSIKNILDNNPQILKRFVNYLTTPDEDPAISQFGDGDKYFGICVLMVTLPGTPMFGHGQWYGFKERYGMEYQRAYLHEPVNEGIRDRHLWELSPLMRNRDLFAEVDHYRIFDLMLDGAVNEDVFIYYNQTEFNQVLVVVNNRFERSSGWISFAYQPFGSDTVIHIKDLLLREDLPFIVFTDSISRMQYIRSRDELENGLFLSLDGYKYHVFSNFSMVGVEYAEIHRQLNGSGTVNLTS